MGMNDCACDANYMCDPWEDAKHCPRDCGPRAEYGEGDGHDANDGTDGKEQQFDGSYQMDGENSDEYSGLANDSSYANPDCKRNSEKCTSHSLLQLCVRQL